MPFYKSIVSEHCVGNKERKKLTSFWICSAMRLAASCAGVLRAYWMAEVSDSTLSFFCEIGAGPAPALWIMSPT